MSYLTSIAVVVFYHKYGIFADSTIELAGYEVWSPMCATLFLIPLRFALNFLLPRRTAEDINIAKSVMCRYRKRGIDNSNLPLKQMILCAELDLAELRPQTAPHLMHPLPCDPTNFLSDWILLGVVEANGKERRCNSRVGLWTILVPAVLFRGLLPHFLRRDAPDSLSLPSVISGLCFLLSSLYT